MVGARYSGEIVRGRLEAWGGVHWGGVGGGMGIDGGDGWPALGSTVCKVHTSRSWAELGPLELWELRSTGPRAARSTVVVPVVAFGKGPRLTMIRTAETAQHRDTRLKPAKTRA